MRKTNFRWPQVEQQSPIARRPSAVGFLCSCPKWTSLSSVIFLARNDEIKGPTSDIGIVIVSCWLAERGATASMSDEHPPPSGGAADLELETISSSSAESASEARPPSGGAADLELETILSSSAESVSETGAKPPGAESGVKPPGTESADEATAERQQPTGEDPAPPDSPREGVCAICLDAPTNPVTLDCTHQFCAVCLDDARAHSTHNQGTECPLCRAPYAMKMKVTVPENVRPGSTFKVTSPAGHLMDVGVPPGATPGTVLMVPLSAARSAAPEANNVPVTPLLPGEIESAGCERCDCQLQRLRPIRMSIAAHQHRRWASVQTSIVEPYIGCCGCCIFCTCRCIYCTSHVAPCYLMCLSGALMHVVGLIQETGCCGFELVNRRKLLTLYTAVGLVVLAMRCSAMAFVLVRCVDADDKDSRNDDGHDSAAAGGGDQDGDGGDDGGDDRDVNNAMTDGTECEQWAEQGWPLHSFGFLSFALCISVLGLLLAERALRAERELRLQRQRILIVTNQPPVEASPQVEV